MIRIEFSVRAVRRGTVRSIELANRPADDNGRLPLRRLQLTEILRERKRRARAHAATFSPRPNFVRDRIYIARNNFIPVMRK